MKNSFIILITLYLGCNVEPLFSQSSQLESTVTISAINQSIQFILNELTAKTKVNFSYSNNIIPLNRFISINEKNVTIESILDKIFNGTQIKYKELEGQIVLYKSNTTNGNAKKIEVIVYDTLYLVSRDTSYYNTIVVRYDSLYRPNLFHQIDKNGYVLETSFAQNNGDVDQSRGVYIAQYYLVSSKIGLFNGFHIGYPSYYNNNGGLKKSNRYDADIDLMYRIVATKCTHLFFYSGYSYTFFTNEFKYTTTKVLNYDLNGLPESETISSSTIDKRIYRNSSMNIGFSVVFNAQRYIVSSGVIYRTGLYNSGPTYKLGIGVIL